MNRVGKKVACVCNQKDDAALNLRKATNVGVFEKQRGANADDEANDQAGEEDEDEDTKTLDQGDNVQRTARDVFVVDRLAGLVPLRRLKQHNGDGVVEDRLAKDDSVQLRVHLVGVENGQNGHRVGSR